MAISVKPPANLLPALDTRPLYLRLEEAMATLLDSYADGERLPSEEQLAALLGVSRTTIREVLRSFEDRGRVIRRHGVGTFAAAQHPVFDSGLETLESFDTLSRRIGLDSGYGSLEIAEIPADATLASLLKIEPGAPVTVVSRTRTANGAVMAYMYDVIPADIVSASELQQSFTGSVLDYFQANGSQKPAYALTRLHSIQASKQLAHHLHVPTRTALLLLEETLYNPENEPINYSRNYYNTEVYQFHIVRRSLG
jgi:GntR family transcriptional regulator